MTSTLSLHTTLKTNFLRARDMRDISRYSSIELYYKLILFKASIDAGLCVAAPTREYDRRGITGDIKFGSCPLVPVVAELKSNESVVLHTFQPYEYLVDVPRVDALGPNLAAVIADVIADSCNRRYVFITQGDNSAERQYALGVRCNADWTFVKIPQGTKTASGSLKFTDGNKRSGFHELYL